MDKKCSFGKRMNWFLAQIASMTKNWKIAVEWPNFLIVMLWTCSFLAKNWSNFVSTNLKLNSRIILPYYHIAHSNHHSNQITTFTTDQKGQLFKVPINIMHNSRKKSAKKIRAMKKCHNNQFQMLSADLCLRKMT